MDRYIVAPKYIWNGNELLSGYALLVDGDRISAIDKPESLICLAPEATLDPYYVDTGVEVITKDNLPK